MEYLSTRDPAKKLKLWQEGIVYDWQEDAAADALALIQQLEEQNAELSGKIGQLEGILQEAKQKVSDLIVKVDKHGDDLNTTMVEFNNTIQQLEAELEDMTARYKIADDCAKKKGEMNEKLYAELTAVKAERDAAVKDLSECTASHCPYCKHWDKPGRAVVCINCRNGAPRCKQHFEWRGVQKED
jgi:chromosome segregation ATPase